VSYVLGPNASGKSNLLDALRFLRDVSKPKGGGLQAAVAERGGISKVRCLHARRDTEVEIDVELSQELDQPPLWRYVLAFKPEGKGAQRLLVSREQVWKDGQLLLDRPDAKDDADVLLKTQTHLEQIQTNIEFRDVVDFLSAITYLHLVPQLLRFGEKIGGHRLTDDPFGQGFLERLAKTPERTRNSRLAKISKALALAVPQFEDLRFTKDELGHPHLEARYAHHRPNAGWQSEEHFSDGTLRLFGLLWALLEGSSMLLLEEPEISLNDVLPVAPDELADPKQSLLRLAKGAPRQVRDDLLKAIGGNVAQGLGYNARLSAWVHSDWCPQRAAERSPSLARARLRLDAAVRDFA